MENIAVVIMTWLTIMEYMCNRLPPIYPACRTHNLALLSVLLLISGILTALTQLVPPVQQELLILPGLLHSPWCFVEFVLLNVFCVAFCGSLFVFLCHCVVCTYSMYGFWWSLWYLQTFLNVSYTFQTTLVTSVGTYLFLYIKL